MPPRTRGIKATKENAGVTAGKKVKNSVKTRKPLADKTNSASDDNSSGISLKTKGKNDKDALEPKKNRSRRNRRLPTRYEENNILKNLSNFSSTSLSPKNNSLSTQQKVTPSKTAMTNLTPHKTPSRVSKSPLISKRPKRICRLPSKLDEFVSPTKNTSIQPAHASTPIPDKPKKKINEENNDKPKPKVQSKENKSDFNGKKDIIRTRSGAKTTIVLADKTKSLKKPDARMEAENTIAANPKQNSESNKKETVETEAVKSNNAKGNKDSSIKGSILKYLTESNSRTKGKTNTKNNTSIRLLESKTKSLKRDSSKLDVYEFTFDPNEEPPPQKKKKKRNPRNPKPKKPQMIMKSTYDKNLEKALATLKKTVASKNNDEKNEKRAIQENEPKSKEATNPSIPKASVKKIIPETSSNTIADVSKASENRYNSIRIEDIAMQFEDNTPHQSIDINYSPVNTPLHAMSPVYETNGLVENPAPSTSNCSIVQSNTPKGQTSNRDPLNLQGHVSFFDEEPVASSSMNLSNRHPTASPWRVEFNNLPIKWQVNSYVKPNMTPAIERSFINYNDSQKKHVYTNIMTEPNECLPQIIDNPIPQTSNFKQTSILSFIKEVVDRNANKKKKPLIIQNNSLFEDTHVAETTSRKAKGIPAVIVEKPNTSGEDAPSENSGAKDSSCDSEQVSDPKKQSEKDKNDVTYFGFDESENQENVSPVKKKVKKNKIKTRRALRAINGDMNKPEEIPMPLAALSKPARIPNELNKVFNEAKAATEPPVFPEQHNDKNTEVPDVNTDTIQSNIDEDDCNSVHLFEDIELVHHLKPTRKSYGKSKKVTFHQSSAINNYNSDNENHGSSGEDDLEDLSFKLPSIKEKKVTKKKPTKKQKLSKKEEKEADEWAAGFNSMCEDIDEFDLLVE